MTTAKFYTLEHVKAGLKQCFKELGHIPSISEYQEWVYLKQRPGDFEFPQQPTASRILAENHLTWADLIVQEFTEDEIRSYLPQSKAYVKLQNLVDAASQKKKERNMQVH